jgi:putative transposase
MLTQRATLFCLDPTPEQAETLGQWAGACRVVYNLALEQRRTFSRPGRSFDWFQQKRELTQLRAEVDWVRAVPIQALQLTLKALDDAFQRFFLGLGGYPRWRKKGERGGFTIQGADYLGFKRLNARRGAIKIPKLGWVKLLGWRPLGGELRSITISHGAGRWHAAVAWKREAPDPGPSSLPAVGIDRGVVNFAAFSDSTPPVKGPNSFKAIQAKLAKAQRRLARKVKFSRNWGKQKAKIACLHRWAANARRDFLHKLSTTIAKSHGLVRIEKLRVSAMTKSAKGTAENPGRNVRAKAGLSRAILDQGWSTFSAMIRYKLQERGGRLEEVDPAYTSQTCAACGAVAKENRATRDLFKCLSCGHADSADHNAAKNILQARTLAAEPPKRVLPKRTGKRKQPQEATRVS